MSTPSTENRQLIVDPGRGLREFSIPCDPATITGTSGIHYSNVLGSSVVLWGLPLATANSTGAAYMSAIHGGLGSDVVNPLGAPAAGFNGNVPAFPGPEVTGYYTPPSVNAGSQTLNGYNNTEKIQRSPGDNPAGNGTIWQGLQGRTKLNFALWISDNTAPVGFMKLELYRDLNSNDKAAGAFGAGAGVTNAQLVGSWIAQSALRNQNKPNFCTSRPFDLPAGCNLYMLFTNLLGHTTNLAVGSIWLS